jgi:hypothetical protein
MARSIVARTSGEFTGVLLSVKKVVCNDSCVAG